MITIDKGKTYLVTGGSGFLGKKTIERIHEKGGKVLTMARDEGKLIQLKQELPYIDFLTGDIADRFNEPMVLDLIHSRLCVSAIPTCLKAAK